MRSRDLSQVKIIMQSPPLTLPPQTPEGVLEHTRKSFATFQKNGDATSNPTLSSPPLPPAHSIGVAEKGNSKKGRGGKEKKQQRGGEKDRHNSGRPLRTRTVRRKRAIVEFFKAPKTSKTVRRQAAEIVATWRYESKERRDIFSFTVRDVRGCSSH